MIYFASDFHLGYPDYKKSREREQLIIKWLDFVAEDARQIHLVGDIFDFWFEWKRVVPKYFVRFLGKLASLADRGIDIHFYPGNHDLWTFGYLEQEIGLKVHRNRQLQTIEGKVFLVEHGDQTPYESLAYKVMTKVFRYKPAQWAYAKLLHPDFSSKIAQRFSARRDRENEIIPYNSRSERQEKYVRWLIDNGYGAEFYVFGHRHLAYEQVINNAKMVVLGEWFTRRSYAVFDGQSLELRYFK